MPSPATHGHAERRHFPLPVSSVLVGACLWGSLFLVFLISLLLDGSSEDPLARQVLSGRRGEALRFLLRVGWLHLMVGAVQGLVAAPLLALLECPRRRRLRLWGLHGLLMLALTCYGMVDRPIFLDAALNLRGGFGELLQRSVTSLLSPRGVVVGTALLLAGWCAASNAARRRLLSRRAALASLLVTAGALILWLGNRRAPAVVTPTDRPNILLVALDSLREDRLEAAGYARSVTPNIDALARRGVSFSEAYVPLARTLPSWASVLTSTYPHTHGLRDMFPGPEQRSLRLPTLPWHLGQIGYHTFVVSDYAGEAFSLVDFGFARTEAPEASSIEVLIHREILLRFPLLIPAINHAYGHRLLPILRYLTVNPHADILVDQTQDCIAEAASDQRPFFGLVFFSGPHIPYAAPYPGFDRFASTDYRGPNKYGFSVRDVRNLSAAEERLDAQEVEQVRALYDGAAFVADRELGRLLSWLEERDLLANTLVLVTADHGEHLYEHGNAVDHGKWFRGGDAASRVPLVLAGPGVPGDGRQISGLVRSLDIMPTLLSLVDAPVAPDTVEGVDLTPLFDDASKELGLSVFAETGVWLAAPTLFAGEAEAMVYPSITGLLTVDPLDHSLVLRREFLDTTVSAKHRMLRRGRHKLVYEPTLTAAHWKLYDVVADPANSLDLATRQPDLLATLKKDLIDWLNQDPARIVDDDGHVVRHFTYSE